MAIDTLFPPMELDEPDYVDRNVNKIYRATGESYPQKTHYIPAELSFREDFVREYLSDSNPVHALMRLGHTQAVALNAAPRLMAEQYVKDLISKRGEHRLTGMDGSQKDDTLRSEMELILRQIMCDPSAKGSERVAAAKELANLRGFHAPVKSDSEDNLGGVMIVPALPRSVDAIDDWEQLSIVSQQELKKNVIKDI
jgi:hypothetical protein